MQVALDFGVFAEERAQAGYILTLSLPGEDDDTCYYDKLDILEQQKLAETESFVLKAKSEPSKDMLAFLRLMNIAGASATRVDQMRCKGCGRFGQLLRVRCGACQRQRADDPHSLTAFTQCCCRGLQARTPS